MWGAVSYLYGRSAEDVRAVDVHLPLPLKAADDRMLVPPLGCLQEHPLLGVDAVTLLEGLEGEGGGAMVAYAAPQLGVEGAREGLLLLGGLLLVLLMVLWLLLLVLGFRFGPHVV